MIDGAFLPNDNQENNENLINLVMEVRLQKCTKHTKIIIPSGTQTIQKLDQKLITLIAKAHLWAKDLHSGKYSTMTEIAQKHGVNKADLSKQVRLTYLAPDIITAIIEGRQPPTLKTIHLRKISNLPTNWEEQRKLLNFI